MNRGLNRHLVWFLLLILFVFAVGGCGSAGTPPERVVRRMYTALSEGDMDAYMDTILPENRRQPNILGLLNVLSVGIGPIGVDLGELTDISIKDLKVTQLQATDGYALVQSEGNLRYPAFTMELQFCDQHDVRRASDGNWYVDVYAPERTQRLERVLNVRQEELSGMMNGGNDWWSSLIPGIERALDLCE